MKLSTKQSQKGFTIIEVMIVLAIAGVIIAAVLVAVPQLQKNQRNTSRRAILGRVKTELDNYIGNNNGSVPSNALFATGATSFTTKYLNPASSFTDPNGNAVTYDTYVAGGIHATPVTPTGNTAAGILYNSTATCSGEDVTGAGTSRQYAVSIGLEGGAAYCLDNK